MSILKDKSKSKDNKGKGVSFTNLTKKIILDKK